MDLPASLGDGELFVRLTPSSSMSSSSEMAVDLVSPFKLSSSIPPGRSSPVVEREINVDYIGSNIVYASFRARLSNFFIETRGKTRQVEFR